MALRVTLRRIIRATVAVGLALQLAACTGGGWLDQSRLEFHTGGIDTGLAGEDRSNSSVAALVGSDGKTVAVLDLKTPSLRGSRAAFSPDNGNSWQRVLFDGKEDPGMGLYSLGAVRQGQWLLMGYREGQVYAFTSETGTDFSLQPTPVLDYTTHTLNEVVGTDRGWLMAASPIGDAPAGPLSLRLSTDGSAWEQYDSTEVGLPDLGKEFHPLDMAGSPTSTLLVGQDVYKDRPPVAKAYASNDGGRSWADVSPDTRDIGPAGNSFRTAAWDGNEFRVTGHGWPGDIHPKRYPMGISGSWTADRGWRLSTDSAWSSQEKEFPLNSKIVYGNAGAMATRAVGRPSDAVPEVMIQASGNPWESLPEPAPAGEGLRGYSAVAAVSDGFLLAGTDSRRGNDQLRLWHVDQAGNVSERCSALDSGALSPPSSPGPYITAFTGGPGSIRAFGSMRSQPVLWDLDGDRSFRNYTTIISDDDQTLDSMAEGRGGEMLLGSQRTRSGQLPVIWSRTAGGQWSAYSGNIFGAGPDDGGSPVEAVLPSSHGFIAAGGYSADGAGHAALAVSKDGRKWEHIHGNEFRGAPQAGRHIVSLAETPSGTVLAGGSMGNVTNRNAVVWMSTDARNFTAVPLPRAEGYANAGLIALKAGAVRTLAVVENRSSGKPTRYAVYSSLHADSAHWEHVTDLEAPEDANDSAHPQIGAPLVAVRGNGFVLAAARGEAGHRELLLMASDDGSRFSERPVRNGVVEREGLTLTALGTAGDRVLLAGVTGPDAHREPFGIAVDLPDGN